MKKLLTFILLGAVIGGCAPAVRLPLRQPSTTPRMSAMSRSPQPALKAQIDSLLDSTLFPPSNLGIKVVSLTTRDTLYALNSTMLFNPASNEKLFTSATALSVLGEDFLFSTVASADSSTQTIFLKGYGDPMLSTDDLDSIASVVASRLPSTKKKWKVAADVSYFDDIYLGEGWRWDNEPESDGMFLTPLCVNSNCIEVRVRPGKGPGDPLQVQTQPATGFVSIENNGITAGDSLVTPLEVSRKWRERTNIITVKGQMLRRDVTPKRTLSVWQPERYAATLFAERLRAAGIQVDSVLTDTVRSTATEIFRFTHRLDSIITKVNKVSDNLSAETVLKTLGAEKRGIPGSARTGLSVVKEFLSSSGIDTTTVTLADGSGLSRYNLTSPHAIVRLLEALYRNGTHFQAFFNSLPIAGVDGTIGYRMLGSRAEENLRAKTGSMNGVSTFSGYVRTADNELLAFSMMMQNFIGSSRRYLEVQDKIGILLSGIKKGDL